MWKVRRALVFAGVALMMASEARAQQRDSDPWFGHDKALHFGASALLASGGYAGAALLTDDVRLRLGVGGGVALAAGVTILFFGVFLFWLTSLLRLRTLEREAADLRKLMEAELRTEVFDAYEKAVPEPRRAAEATGEPKVAFQRLKEHVNTIDAMGGEQAIRITGRWEGDTLETSWSLNAKGVTISFNDSWSVSDDGKVLTFIRTAKSPQGDFTVRTVYNKQ